MGCMLGQHDESGKKERVIYYLSKKFTTCEMNYSLLERTCCALVWASHRLRQYMLSHTTWLISKIDEDMFKSKGKDPLEGLGGPMTRARARKAKEALQHVLSILFEYKPKFQGEKSKVVSCIMAQMEED